LKSQYLSGFGQSQAPHLILLGSANDVPEMPVLAQETHQLQESIIALSDRSRAQANLLQQAMKEAVSHAADDPFPATTRAGDGLGVGITRGDDRPMSAAFELQVGQIDEAARRQQRRLSVAEAGQLIADINGLVGHHAPPGSAASKGETRIHPASILIKTNQMVCK